MKQLLIKTLLLLPLVIFVIITNLVFDPAHIFDNGAYEKNLADILLSGKNVADVSDYDNSLFLKDYIDGLTTKKDIIALGSSRSLTIKAELFPRKSFFNCSINRARIDDYEYTYQLFKAKGMIPQEIIIGADPWILFTNKNDLQGVNGGSLILNKSQHVLNVINNQIGTHLNVDNISKYYQLISPRYFQISFSLLVKHLTHSADNTKYFPVDDPNDPRIFKYADGSINNILEATNDPQEIKKRALNYDPTPLLGGYEKLDIGLLNRFESLIDTMKKDGIQVVLYLPPYHPITFKNLVSSKDYKFIVDIQNYFINLGIKKNIEVLGSYNPQDFNLQDLDFYDGIHPRESVSRIIFKQTNDSSETVN